MNTRQDRRYSKTEAALKESITALLAKKTIDQITVEEITGNAQINRVTFYKHYYDKYDLAASCEKENYMNELKQQVVSCHDLKEVCIRLINATKDILDRIDKVETANPFYQTACIGKLRMAIQDAFDSYPGKETDDAVRLCHKIMGSSIIFDAARIMTRNSMACNQKFAASAADAVIKGLNSNSWEIYVAG